MNLMEEYRKKLVTAEEAVKCIHSGDRVFIGLNSSTAYALTDALWERRSELENVFLGSSTIMRPVKTFTVKEGNPFGMTSPFVGPVERTAMKIGLPSEYTSFHLSQVDKWVYDVCRPTVTFLQVSPPDEDGNMSLGPSGNCIAPFLINKSDRIILEVNRQVPYVYGMDAFIDASKADYIVEADYPIPPTPQGDFDKTTEEIAANVLQEIPDGATLQLGIGLLSSAIGYGLADRNDLGVFSEMFSPSLMYLMKNGNITNRKKGFHDGISVYSFASGTQEMYEFMDRNPDLYSAPFPYVNDARNIAKNKRMISVNSAMSVNLFGETAADCIGFHQQSAVGGQLDYVRGAQWSEGGKSIIALASSFVKNGKRESKIVLDFPFGTPVTTPRSDIQYVATEYGIVNLKPLTTRERAIALIKIAHPDFRDELTEKAKAAGLI